MAEVLTAMEQEGINLNTAFLKTFEGELADIQRLEKDIRSSREKFNLASPKIGTYPLWKLKLVDKPKKTKLDSTLLPRMY